MRCAVLTLPVMAVRALPRAQARAPLRAASIPPGVLCLALVAPALDLFATEQPGALVAGAALFAAVLACAALIVLWACHLRASWLAAASLAALSGAAMRLVGADVAPLLSLLAVVALGLGGAFASSERPNERALLQGTSRRSRGDTRGEPRRPIPAGPPADRSEPEGL
jgi:hypothetical protein